MVACFVYFCFYLQNRLIQTNQNRRSTVQWYFLPLLDSLVCMSMVCAKLRSVILPSVVLKRARGAVLACARSRSRARPRSFGRAPLHFGRAQLRRCAMDSWFKSFPDWECPSEKKIFRKKKFFCRVKTEKIRIFCSKSFNFRQFKEFSKNSVSSLVFLRTGFFKAGNPNRVDKPIRPKKSNGRWNKHLRCRNFSLSVGFEPTARGRFHSILVSVFFFFTWCHNRYTNGPLGLFTLLNSCWNNTIESQCLWIIPIAENKESLQKDADQCNLPPRTR
jgi:hypothetical protein